MSERADNIFHALDWQREPWADTSRIMLLTGTAGGGKSKIAGEKLNAYLKRYPKSTGVVVRKTRASMVNSTLLFLERDVMGGDSTIKHVTSKRRFEYSNGSVLAYGGMADEDQREQLRSIGQDGSVDIAWMEEANRFDENDFNELIARLRGRSAPWRQVILSTNADSPAHWIYKRLITGGEASVYFSKAENNTYNPDDYTETLNSLTGILKKRLAEGLWVQAEGLVYEAFNPQNHVIDSFPIPHDWDRFLSIDFGYWPSPFVCQWWALSPDDDLFLYREVYGTKKRVREWADIINELSQGELINGAFADHSDESRETLDERGVPTSPAVKEMDTGIQLVMERLAPLDGGRPRIFFFRDSLQFEDYDLIALKRPVSTIEELGLYTWGGKALGSGKERPVKMHAHGMHAMRYLVSTIDQGVASLGNHTATVRPVTAGIRRRIF